MLCHLQSEDAIRSHSDERRERAALDEPSNWLRELVELNVLKAAVVNESSILRTSIGSFD